MRHLLSLSVFRGTAIRAVLVTEKEMEAGMSSLKKILIFHDHANLTLSGGYLEHLF